MPCRTALRRRRRRCEHCDERSAFAARALAELDRYTSDARLRCQRTAFSKAMVPRRANVARFGSPPADLGDRAAADRQCLRELLGAHEDYTGESCVVEPLDFARLALPVSGSRAVVLPPRSASSTSGGWEQLLLPTNVAEGMVEQSEVKRPYMGALLRHPPCV